MENSDRKRKHTEKKEQSSPTILLPVELANFILSVDGDINIVLCPKLNKNSFLLPIIPEHRLVGPTVPNNIVGCPLNITFNLVMYLPVKLWR